MKPRLSSKLPSPGRMLVGSKGSMTRLRPATIRTIADPKCLTAPTTSLAARAAWRTDGRLSIWHRGVGAPRPFSISSGSPNFLSRIVWCRIKADHRLITLLLLAFHPSPFLKCQRSISKPVDHGHSSSNDRSTPVETSLYVQPFSTCLVLAHGGIDRPQKGTG